MSSKMLTNFLLLRWTCSIDIAGNYILGKLFQNQIKHYILPNIEDQMSNSQLNLKKTL